MNRFTKLLPAFLSMLAAVPASAAPTATCTPARAGAHVATLPDAWRSAVEALITSTGSPDQPWGCVGGEVDLVVEGSSGTLTVVDSNGQAVSREVTTPDDVGPLGEALLAKPVVEPEVAAPVESAPKQTIEAEKTNASTNQDPRVIVAATVGPRFAGPQNILWGSFGVLAAVPFRPWGAGIWLRYDGFSQSLDGPRQVMRDLVIGGAGYWSAHVGRLEIRPMLRPSLAIVTRRTILNNGGPGPGPQQIEPNTREDTEFDFRLGAESQFVVTLTKRLRGVIGIDAEVSPDQLISSLQPHRPGEPAAHLPVYTVGLNLGVEVAVP